ALEVFGTAILAIAAGQVDAPEIVVAQRQLAKNVLHRFTDEAGHTGGVLRLDQASLRLRHAEQVHDELARDDPVDRAIPQHRRNAFVVDAPLLVEAARVEQVDGGCAQLRLCAEPAAHAARDDAGEPMEIEAAAATGEPVR